MMTNDDTESLIRNDVDKKVKRSWGYLWLACSISPTVCCPTSSYDLLYSRPSYMAVGYAGKSKHTHTDKIHAHIKYRYNGKEMEYITFGYR